MGLAQKIALLALLASSCESGSTSKKIATPAAPLPVPIQPIEPQPDSNKPTPGPETPTPENPKPQDSLNLRPGLSVSKNVLLRNIGRHLALQAAQFQQQTASLQITVDGYCEQMSQDSLKMAQDQWKIVMSTWQQFEVFQIGPVAENAKTLKYNIYAWPDPANYCKIDEESLKASKISSYQLPPNNNRKGLQALEYLLFENSLTSRCKLTTAVGKEWEVLSASQKWQARCAYLKPLASDLAQRGATLSIGWGNPDDNALSRLLTDPNNEQGLIQILYENIFYIDLEVKNKKVAAPAGQDVKHCPSSPTPCPDKEEFPFAQFSRTALDQNLRSFVDLIFGPKLEQREGGFSALMRAEGRNDVADRSEAQISELAKLINENAGISLLDLISKQNQEDCNLSTVSWLCRLRSGIRDFAVDLKNEYSAVLKVKAPEAAQGDND